MPLVKIGTLARFLSGRQTGRPGHEIAEGQIAARGEEVRQAIGTRFERFKGGNRKNPIRFFGTAKMRVCQAPANDVAFYSLSRTGPIAAQLVTLHIRDARSEDAVAIDRLLRHLDSIQAEMRPDLCRPTSASPRGECFLENVLSDGRQKIAVAVAHGHVVAFAHLCIKATLTGFGLIERRYAEITSVVVDPRFQRNGIAWRLMGSVLTWASSKGISDHEITVDELNTSAKSLCKRIGFQSWTTTARRTADYYG
jgi:ribosomal protein S18 acetylase RimI-like enzyme